MNTNNTTTSTFTLEIPKADTSLLKSLVKRMMAYKLLTTHQFEKDLKRCKKRGLPMDKLKEVINELVTNGRVPTQFRPHLLLI